MPADLGFDYEDCFERNPRFRKSDIAVLRSWIEGPETSKYIPTDISNKQLLLFYNACHMVIDDTKKCIKAYYSVRDKDPEHFDDRDFNLPLMKDGVRYQEYVVLPERTKEGYLVVFHRLFDDTPERYHFNTAVKLLFMTIDRCLYENGPQAGMLFVFDMKGVKLGHLTRVNLSSLAKFFNYIQDGIPASIEKIHILNVVPFFDKVMMLLKPFMKKELISLMALHPPGMDMEKFYEIIPKRCLPLDFGGDQPDVQTLNRKNTERLIALTPYFNEEEKHREMFTKSKKKLKELKDFQNLNID